MLHFIVDKGLPLTFHKRHDHNSCNGVYVQRKWISCYNYCKRQQLHLSPNDQEYYLNTNQVFKI